MDKTVLTKSQRVILSKNNDTLIKFKVEYPPDDQCDEILEQLADSHEDIEGQEFFSPFTPIITDDLDSGPEEYSYIFHKNPYKNQHVESINETEIEYDFGIFALIYLASKIYNSWYRQNNYNIVSTKLPFKRSFDSDYIHGILVL